MKQKQPSFKSYFEAREAQVLEFVLLFYLYTGVLKKERLLM